jgi:hypothetical protein
MTEQTNPENSIGASIYDPEGTESSGKSKRSWLRRPSWTVIGGAMIGGGTTFGYLVNSYFFCLSQTNCSLAAEWIVAFAIIGTSAGAIWGWLVGKFFGRMYRMMRVD